MSQIASPPVLRPGLRPMATIRTIVALMLREMATTYGRSPGGYLWAIVEPVGGIAILSYAFSLFLHRPALGTNFPLFYATAYLPFMLYAQLSQKIGQALQFSKPLLAYPSVTFADAILARFALNALTQIVVFALVMLGIHVIYGLSAVLDWPAILLALAMAAALGLGIGTMNCYLRAVFPFWDTVWGIINRPLFIVSGLFFLFEDVPLTARGPLWWNPLIHVTGEMRRGVYPGYEAAYVSPTYVFALALILLALGLMLLKRAHRDILND
jgi:capsular polysaccharide transport system permease protein